MNEFLFRLLLLEGTQAIYELNKTPQQEKPKQELTTAQKKEQSK